jgi:hypothetical protein
VSEQRQRFLTSLLSNRSSVIELLAVAILLAFGVNIASVVYSSLSVPVALLWGLIVTFSSLLYLGLRYIKRQHRVVLRGFLVYDPSIQRFLPVAEYDLAEKVDDYLRAAFAENKRY